MAGSHSLVQAYELLPLPVPLLFPCPPAGPVVLVVDCPSAAFLPALTAAPLLSECATGAKRDRGERGLHGVHAFCAHLMAA